MTYYGAKRKIVNILNYFKKHQTKINLLALFFGIFFLMKIIDDKKTDEYISRNRYLREQNSEQEVKLLRYDVAILKFKLKEDSLEMKLLYRLVQIQAQELRKYQLEEFQRQHKKWTPEKEKK